MNNRKTPPPRTPSHLRNNQKSPPASSLFSSQVSLIKLVRNYSLAIFLVLGAVWGIWLIYLPMPDNHAGAVHEKFIISSSRRFASGNSRDIDADTANKNNAGRMVNSDRKLSFLPSFEQVLERAQQNQQHCDKVIAAENRQEPEMDVIEIANMTTARLHGFGVMEALQQWQTNPQRVSNHIQHGASDTECEISPETECDETQFTVIFMAYNPDRVTKLIKQMRTMLSPPYETIVREIVLVWNGPRAVNESQEGNVLLQYIEEQHDRTRIVYPLKQGLPNDLMNRYHPDIVQVKTKGILYYDDDGPFYSYEAVLGGFELWKRNANAQIGAMARVIDLGPRQVAEKQTLLGNDNDPPNDRAFISHCYSADNVEYNYRFFANFQANMVLPSGSFLHSNYLCFLWHPVFEPIRKFVRSHEVHPDDITVSMMVSQLAGRAPKVYSRRINMETKEAQLQEAASLRAVADEEPQQQKQMRRRLLFGIDWDKSPAMDHSKEKWAQLRSGAINSLVRYFGSINSGSIGWCYGTEYHTKGKNGEDFCSPEMARFGKLPWMKIDHTPKDTCP